MKIHCWTKFDITATGVTGHFKSARLPFTDRSGQLITNEAEWHRARNQQRNWETLQQIVSLRAQIFDLEPPVAQDHEWTFEFSVEQEGLFTYNDDPVGILKQDCAGVPMLIGLNETVETALLSPLANIGFAVTA